jgi:hypothetical protein
MSCAVCTVHVGMRSMSFLVEPQNHGLRFPGLVLKIGSYGLVIWVSKSLLSLKTKKAMICRLRHKTNGRATVWYMRRDLPWKQVRLDFPSLPQDWRMRDGG